MASLCRFLALLVLYVAVQDASAALSAPTTHLLRSSTARVHTRGLTLVAKAGVKARGKAGSEPENQLQLVLNKISDGASAFKAEADKLTADARIKLRSAYGDVEKTVKEHPRETAVAALVAITLAFLLGEGDAKPLVRKSSIVDSLLSVGNTTTKALLSTTGGLLGSSEAVLRAILNYTDTQIWPHVEAAGNVVNGAILDACALLAACAAATPSFLNQSFWAVESGAEDLAAAIANISLHLAGMCTDSMGQCASSMTSWGQDFAGNTTFRVKNVGSALAALVNPSALSYTIQSGSVKSGSFTVDLGKKVVLGAVIVENKKCKDKGKKGKKDLELAGTHDFEILVSEDGKEWSRAHKGSLHPGPPKANSQYVTFKGKWARYVKFVSLSGYTGGAGLQKIYLHSPMGLNTLHWILRFKDTLQSIYEANAPEFWKDIQMPPPAKDLQSTAVYVPLLISKYLGLSLPDDLWLGNVTKAVTTVYDGCCNATMCGADIMMTSLNMTYQAVTGTVCAVADVTANVAHKVGLVHVSNAVINTTAATAAAAVDVVKSPFGSWSKKVVEKEEFNGCLPLSILGALALGGGYVYKDDLGEAVGPFAEEIKKQADKARIQVEGAVKEVSSKVQDVSKSIVDSVESAASSIKGKGKDLKSSAGKWGVAKQDKSTGPRRFGKSS